MKQSKLLLILVSLIFTKFLFAQNLGLKKTDGIVTVNTNVTELEHKGKAALKVKAMVSNKRALVLIPNSDFENGTIEFEMAANRAPDSHPESRGFAGVAFHVTSDTSAYDVIYLRATNGRADDQVRRNHTVQYMAQPDFDFDVLRKKFPEKYETYVDMVPDEWMQLKIEVKNRITKLYVNGQEQPTLIVKDMLNPNPSGSIALWVGGGTEAYYRNLVLKKDK